MKKKRSLLTCCEASHENHSLDRTCARCGLRSHDCGIGAHMIAVGILLAVIAGIIAMRRYEIWRDKRDRTALNSDLWDLTLPYEPKARERRQ